MQINLPEELEQYVRSKVAAGEFRTADEVVVDSLQRTRSQEDLRRDLDKAWHELERGELVDGEAVFAELRQKSERLRAQGL
jgi:putative addiction module CopG family antidote